MNFGIFGKIWDRNRQPPKNGRFFVEKTPKTFGRIFFGDQFSLFSLKKIVKKSMKIENSEIVVSFRKISKFWISITFSTKNFARFRPTFAENREIQPNIFAEKFRKIFLVVSMNFIARFLRSFHLTHFNSNIVHLDLVF